MAETVGRTHKICSMCGESKPNEEFHFTVPERGYRASRCKSCAREYQRSYNQELKRTRPEELASRRRRYSRKARYGLTALAYEDLLERQGGVCSICEQQDAKGRDLVVDHDHHTGFVRGLLCPSCNIALGLLKDDARILLRAQEYLDEASALSSLSSQTSAE